MQLSKKEEQTYSALRKNKVEVFSTKDFALLTNNTMTQTYNLIKALKKKGAIDTLFSGMYAFKDTNDLLAGALACWPSYMSFLSALNYYGMSDNLPQKITYASTAYKQHERFMYVCIAAHRFFGYTRIGEVIIARKEKAFIDSLLLPRQAGGIRYLASLLVEYADTLDKKTLVEYAVKMRSDVVIRRLGYILSKQLSKEHVRTLKKHLGEGVRMYDPACTKRSQLNKEWKLYTDVV